MDTSSTYIIFEICTSQKLQLYYTVYSSSHVAPLIQNWTVWVCPFDAYKQGVTVYHGVLVYVLRTSIEIFSRISSCKVSEYCCCCLLQIHFQIHFPYHLQLVCFHFCTTQHIMKQVSVTFLYDMFSVFAGKALTLQAVKYNLFEIWNFYFLFCLL